jgi:hypothetical protein
MCDFSGETFKGFSRCATTTQLLSSGKFCKLRYHTIPVKSASANVSFYSNTQKCQILSCDTLVANEQYKDVYNSQHKIGEEHFSRAFAILAKSDY